MLHKMGFDCICEICGNAKTYEQMSEDAEMCWDCFAELMTAAAEQRQEMILEAALERDHD
jgi:uncharacterized protein (DUF983 family)